LTIDENVKKLRIRSWIIFQCPNVTLHLKTVQVTLLANPDLSSLCTTQLRMMLNDGLSDEKLAILANLELDTEQKTDKTVIRSWA